MTAHDPDGHDPAQDAAPTEPDPAPPSPETEHIEDDGEPLGANFA